MFDGKELALREEVIKLKDDLNGKDLALGHLTNTLTKSANENQRLGEMISFFKNKLIIESCFN